MSNIVPWPLTYRVAVGYAKRAIAVFIKGSATTRARAMGSD